MDDLFGQLDDAALLESAYETAHKGWARYKDKLSLEEKYKALDTLARIGKAPGQVTPPAELAGVAQFKHLVDRLKAIDYPEPENWVRLRVTECGADPEKLSGWNYQDYIRTLGTVEEFERAIRELDKKANKLNRRGERKAELPPPKKQEKSSKEPKMSLFSKLKPKADEATGEITSAPASSEASKVIEQNKAEATVHNDELMRALAILELNEMPKLASRESVDEMLRKRALIINEYAYVYKQYRDVIQSLESQLDAWDAAIKPLIDLYDAANPPATGKTQKFLYGTFGRRDQGESLSMDPELERDRQKWLGLLDPKLKARFGVVGRMEYSCNWDAIKKDWLETAPKERVPIPGTIHKEARNNVFYVSPSLDTVRNNVREGKWEPKRI